MALAKRATEEVELDLGCYQLRRQGRRVRLEKKPMELLIFLVARREQMVTREDIVTHLWGSNLFIDSDRSINNVVRKIRTALGDDCGKPRYLETIIGKGYRFIGPVRVIDAQYGSHKLGPSTAQATRVGMSDAWSNRPSLAVLPLYFVGNVAEDVGLCLGFADELVARLGNLQGVDVLPMSAVVNFPPETTPAEVASRLGVRFVVHGAVQVAKGLRRLSLEMWDTHWRRACFTKKSEIEAGSLPELGEEVAKKIAGVLRRPLGATAVARHARYSQDPLAYAEFMRGYQLSTAGNPKLLEEATQRLASAVTRDPGFSLAHATLSLVCATRHFELDPASVWLEKAEFHCRRAVELNPDLPEAHVAKAFLLWGPSKNFQHLEAIAELKRALALQSNLPHAFNRLGTILAHIGLLDHAREMYERGRAFDPKKALSHSVVQVYIWKQEYEMARREIQAWREESPTNKYPIYFAPQPAMATGDWNEAKTLLNQAMQLLPEEPMVISLQGLFYAQTGKAMEAMDCLARACSSPKSFGHAHHSHYQIACILAVLGKRNTAFEWLERSVGTGFACWPYFLKDPSLKNVRELPEFEVLISSLQAKYPDHLGLL